MCSNIVANLPYIATELLPTLAREVQHDPRCALDGGVEGLQLLRPLLATATRHLHGRIALEIGHDQAAFLTDELARHNSATFVSQPTIKGGTDSFSQLMDKILVHGGNTLSGAVRISGIKKLRAPDSRGDAAHPGAVRHPSRSGFERHPLHAADPVASRCAGGARQWHGDRASGEDHHRGAV